MRDWSTILSRCGVRPGTAEAWGQVFADTIKADTFSSAADLPDFLGQILVESAMLEKMEENLNYSAARIVQVWPGRFPTLDAALPYQHDPEKLANKVYGARMGNVNLGDGWRYRARSPVGITGRNNYTWLGDLMGQDLVDLPELLSQPHYSLEATIHWWEDRIQDSMLGDTAMVTYRVNGGHTGLDDRERLTDLARRVLA